MNDPANITSTATAAPAPVVSAVAAAAAPAIETAPDIDPVDQHELTVLTPHPLVGATPTDFSPKSLDEAMKLCEFLASSTLVPKEYQNNPGNCFVAIQWGAEIGLKPLQAMQNIATINGRPSLWGDAQLALVRNSPHCEYVLEGEDADGTAVCRAKRRGEPEQIRRFSIEDQKTAGLAGKQGPHSQYPKRMRQLRARAFALRDVFTDVLRGIPQTEEVLFIRQFKHDELPANATPRQIAQAAAPAADKTGKYASQIADFETLAREQGFEAFKAAWGRLDKDTRTAIGIPERDRIGKIGQDADAARGAGGQQQQGGQQP